MFGKRLANLMTRLLGYIPVDEVADKVWCNGVSRLLRCVFLTLLQMAAKYMHDCLPPCLTER